MAQSAAAEMANLLCIKGLVAPGRSPRRQKKDAPREVVFFFDSAASRIGARRVPL
jgi:hypothetical protein